MSDAQADMDALAVLVSRFHDETWLCSMHEKARWLVEHGVSVRAVAPAGAPEPSISSDPLATRAQRLAFQVTVDDDWVHQVRNILRAFVERAAAPRDAPRTS